MGLHVYISSKIEMSKINFSTRNMPLINNKINNDFLQHLCTPFVHTQVLTMCELVRYYLAKIITHFKHTQT